MSRTKLFFYYQIFFLLCYFSECHTIHSIVPGSWPWLFILPSHIDFSFLNIFYICPHLSPSTAISLGEVLLIIILPLNFYFWASLPSVSHPLIHSSPCSWALSVRTRFLSMVGKTLHDQAPATSLESSFFTLILILHRPMNFFFYKSLYYPLLRTI